MEARRILVNAGYPEGEEAFTLTCLLDAVDFDGIDMASMVMDYWAAIDVTLKLVQIEGPAYTSLTFMKPLEERVGDYDCLIQGDAPHDAPLSGLSNAYHPLEVSNLANYVDDYFTEQFDYALTLVDDDERNAILKEITVHALGSAAYLSFGSPASLRYHWPWVKNYYGEKADGCITFGALFSRMWIDQDLKAEMGH
ncbi:hypothetical protein ES708_13135 [subsurface metagenome]